MDGSNAHIPLEGNPPCSPDGVFPSLITSAARKVTECPACLNREPYFANVSQEYRLKVTDLTRTGNPPILWLSASRRLGAAISHFEPANADSQNPGALLKSSCFLSSSALNHISKFTFPSEFLEIPGLLCSTHSHLAMSSGKNEHV